MQKAELVMLSTDGNDGVMGMAASRRFGNREVPSGVS